LVLELFKNKKYFLSFYSKNISLTKKDIKSSVTIDNLIIQTISNIDDLNRVINLLSKRLREWYALYLPELGNRIFHQEKFIELVLNKNKKELMKELEIKDSMGSDLDEEHFNQIKELAEEIKNLFILQKKQELYLEKNMKKHCPNLLEIAGTTIGAKLLEISGTLKHLALLPASTIQLLGAEKALFRHLKTGSRSPKYGIIFSHQLIQKAKKKEQGKAARALADKLSMCARLDFFKGEFKAKDYKKELEKRFR
jgi:nucleolar protein 56